MYTNAQLHIQPGYCEPTLIFATNYTTNVVVTYQNTLLNVYTNSFSPTSQLTVVETNIFTTNGAQVGTLFTNVTTNIFNVNVPSGDFFLIPTNWCGFSIVANLFTNVITTATTVYSVGPVPLVIPPLNATPGLVQYSQTQITSFTNHTLVVFPGVCEPALITNVTLTTGIVTNYQFTFINIYTNYYAPTSMVTVVTTNIFTTNGATVGTLFTNVFTNTSVVDTPNGDFFLIPPQWCSFTVLGTLLTNVVTTSNTVTATVPPGVNNSIGEQFSTTTYSTFTNHILLIQPQSCATVPDVPRLRQGIEKIQFIRADFDSLLGQTFQPITNDYTMVMVTNSQLKTQFFRRIVTQPDILIDAADISATIPFFNAVVRTTPNFDTANALPGLSGPGTINPATTITFNKVGDIFDNGSLALFGFTTNAFLNESTQPLFPILAWASYDGSTNAPIVFPSGTSIQNIENQMLIQISPPPPTLTDGNNGVAYPPVNFIVSGGAFTAPFTWSLGNGTVLPAGLTLVSNPDSTATLSGTPTQVGTFDFTIQLTDLNGRSVQWNYIITIH
jgi:hypothetical protein